MMKALIICAGDDNDSEVLKEYAKNSDYIICADGGYNIALNAGIVPDLVIGDFDSCSNYVDKGEKIVLPCEKDETDTQYSVRYAIKKGADEIVIYGAFGGRLDHTYANIALLSECLENKVSAVATDGKTFCKMVDSKIKLNGKKGDFISVFSFSDISRNVSIKGLKYEIDNCNLKKSDIFGISNEFLDSEAEITVEEGKLLIICN